MSTAVLDALRALIERERQAAQAWRLDIWQRPLADKLAMGWTQRFVRVEPAGRPRALWAYVDVGDGHDKTGPPSRFRQGDLLALHAGSPLQSLLARRLTFEKEEEGRWLLMGESASEIADLIQWAASADASADTSRTCWADPDTIDLTPCYLQALEDIETSAIGQEFVLPLLEGTLEPTFDPRDVEEGERLARAQGFNADQARAVGLGLGAQVLACIQGPPGTGKTQVLARIAQCRAARGERVLLTSHTHTAINHALNQIHALGVNVAKVGRASRQHGLREGLAAFETFGDWPERPTHSYVVGATPFATATRRLEGYTFDTVIIDEASQMTAPLTLMALRTARCVLFVGDQQQLPPVVLSPSVLQDEAYAPFAALTRRHAEHNVMLTETYRMNQALTDWPSRQYYAGKLVAHVANRERVLRLSAVPEPWQAIFDPQACGVFVANDNPQARTRNAYEAAQVAELCSVALEGGLKPQDIGVVTPYRAQGRAIAQALVHRCGWDLARLIVADTVERMQGQERELIILSLATGDPAFLGAVAPFFFQPQRLNVAMTRARTKLIVFGPKPQGLPPSDDPRVNAWMAAYADFIAQLRHVYAPIHS